MTHLSAMLALKNAVWRKSSGQK